MRETARIFAMVFAAALAYGIAHDQVTVRLAPEYFTVAHARLIETESATLLALFWGVVATWAAGTSVGALLTLAARAGHAPRRSARELRRPLATLWIAMALAALVAGAAGLLLARAGLLALPEPLASQVPVARHARFFAAYFATATAYGVGICGGVGLSFSVWLGRRGAVREATPR